MKKIISILTIVAILVTLYPFTTAQALGMRAKVPVKPEVEKNEVVQTKGNVDRDVKNNNALAITGLDKSIIGLKNAQNNIDEKNTIASNERVIVLFKTHVDKNLISQSKGSINREYMNIKALAVSIPTVAIKGLLNNPNIIAVETDIEVQTTQQTIDWGITRTNAPTAWSSNFTGKGVKIAVIDTGIAQHDDLSVTGGIAFTSYTASYADDHGHGTHVAGIIAAKNNGFGSVGIAPESSLYAVKVLGKDGSGYLSDVIAGIDWSITNNMDIVNLSLGTTTSSSTLQQVVDKAYSHGVLIVAAAGNSGTSDGTTDTVNYPAKYNSVIAVSATDSKDQRASFSSTGHSVEVAAPGVNIFSTYLGNKYATMSGTSMAAPYTAGNLALLKQAYPTLSHAQLRSKLQELVVDLGTSGRDTWFGFGLIQVPNENQSTEIIEPTLLETKTGISTNKSAYLAGEKVTITAGVTNSEDEIIQGAVVKITITPPKGKISTVIGTTNQNGEVIIVMTTKRNSPKGTYTVLAETSYSGHVGSSANTTFQIN